MIQNPYRASYIDSTQLAARLIPQCPIGLESDLLRPGARGSLRFKSPQCAIPTKLVLTSHRARRYRRPKKGFVLYRERLDCAFLIENITVAGESLSRGETYMADMFYPDFDPPPLKTRGLMPGDSVVVSIRNIGRVQAVLRACLYTIPGDDYRSWPPSCPQVKTVCR